MNLIPCGLIADVHGTLPLLGLAAFPFVLGAALIRVLTEWPGEIIWLIAGVFIPVRAKVGFIIAVLIAWFGFFGSWCAYSLNDFGSVASAADNCINVNGFARTFLAALLAYAAGLALRPAWMQLTKKILPAK